MVKSAPILIAGGGIGGLAAALALARRGLSAIILEKRDDAREAGAGIQLGPNAVHALMALGAADGLAAAAAIPEAICVRDGASGRVLAELPLGAWIAARHGAPYWTVHRQDLHAALLSAARNSGGIEIVSGFEVARLEDTGSRVRVADAAGRMREGGALIGADGVGSVVRRGLLGDIALAHSGKTATRCVIGLSETGSLSSAHTGVWLSPDAHVVHYPVSGGREIAVVAIIDEDWREPGWHASADRDQLLSRLGSFSPILRSGIASGGSWHKWALADAAQLPAWSRGRVALLGDAAHPILPFLAQGGALALEDALELAAALANAPADIAGALVRYGAARRPRAARVQQASARNGRIYHLNGAARTARDLVLAGVPGGALMRGLDWLYGWRPPTN
jgi:salicylate hydroxylase